MKMNKTLTAAAVSTVLGTAAFAPTVAQAAFTLDITGGSFDCLYSADTAQASGCLYAATTNLTGSFFDMGGNFANSLSSSVGLDIDGVTQPHVNANNPVSTGDTGNITDPWLFFSTSQYGINFSASPIVVSYTDGTNTTAEIDMSGWRVAWSASTSINMGAGAPAAFTFNNTANTYSFDYTAIVPTGGFSGTQYDLHLEGTFSGDITTVIQPAAAVPVPAAVWLFGSGLVGLVGVARRRKQA